MRRTLVPGSVDWLRDVLRGFERRLKDLERVRNPPTGYVERNPTPLDFHWPGAIDDYVSTRNGPGEFGGNGVIRRIRYRWDTAPATTVTVQWRLNDVVAFTHTLAASTNPHVELPGHAYAQETIVAVVTEGDATGSGLTAFVYFE